MGFSHAGGLKNALLPRTNGRKKSSSGFSRGFCRVDNPCSHNELQRIPRKPTSCEAKTGHYFFPYTLGRKSSLRPAAYLSCRRCCDPVRIAGSRVDGPCNRWHVACDDSDELPPRIHSKPHRPCGAAYGVVGAAQPCGDLGGGQAVESHFVNAFRGRPADCGVARYRFKLAASTAQRKERLSCVATRRLDAISTRTRAGRTQRTSAAWLIVSFMPYYCHADGECQLMADRGRPAFDGSRRRYSARLSSTDFLLTAHARPFSRNPRSVPAAIILMTHTSVQPSCVAASGTEIHSFFSGVFIVVVFPEQLGEQ